MAAGDPTGEDLCVGTTNGDTISSEEEREITFSVPVELTSGVRYAIVCRASGAGGGADFVSLWRKSSNNYANGSGGFSVNSGDDWTQEESTDYWFATKASGVEKDTHKENDLSAPAIFGAIWRDQTFIASSTYTISSVVLKLSKGGTPGTLTVSIRATVSLPGKPTNPSPGDTASDITLDESPLSWDASDPAADTYRIYFREQGDDWGLVGVAQAGVEFTIDFGTLAYGTTYEWRIDATNVAGTTTGDTWTFDTITFDKMRISYRLLTGGIGSGPYDDPPGDEGVDWSWTGENNMITLRRLVAAANSKIWFEDV